MFLPLSLFAAVVAGSPLQVRIMDKGEGSRPAAFIVAEPLSVSGSGEFGPVRRQAGERTTLLPLPPGLWKIRASAPDRWSWGVEATVAADTAAAVKDIELTLFPVGRLTGTLRPPVGGDLPSSISLHVRHGVGPKHFPGGLDEEQVTCPVHQHRWTCEVPAGIPLDLEVVAAPYGPSYLWDVTVAPEATRDIGIQSLFRGSSLAGWVLFPADGAPRHSAVVQLTAPDGRPVKPSSEVHFEFEDHTERSGFFQLGPLPPGRYHLGATAEGYVSEHAVVELSPDKEERLRDPLGMKPRATLSIAVHPPAAPDGSPWTIRLLSVRGRAGHLLVRGERVADDGTWSRGGLAAGEYRLFLVAGNARWHEQTVSLEPHAPPISISIQTLRLTGTAHVGDEPVVGQVMLAEKKSRVQASFPTDGEGKFEGNFPGVEVEEAEWVAHVTSSDPASKRMIEGLRPASATAGSLHFDLRLPSGVLEGTVIDEGGAGRPAVVLVQEEDPPGPGAAELSLVEAHTDAEGRFRISGLGTRRYRVYARALHASSDDVPQSDTASIEIDAAGSPAKATLILSAARRVTGTVVTPSGLAVPGATVTVVAADRPELLIKVRSTDADGRLETSVPAPTRHVVVNVEADGIGRRTLGLPLPQDGHLEVRLQPAGGLLILDLGKAPADPSSMTLIYHDGGFVGVGALAAWSARNGGTADVQSLRVPLMSAGAYRVCRLVGFSEYSAFIAGTLPKGKCDAGQLELGAELSLTVPPAQSASPPP